jgi:5-deoxy-glucuronate isomerase
MKNRDHPANWKFTSSENEGFFQVISPDNSACKITWIFRLNLKKGNSWQLSDKKLEINGVIIQGKITIRHNDSESDLQKFDSFYIPANEHVTILANENCSIFIGGSLYEGKGSFFTRKYDLSLPMGAIHQIHGKPPYRREVFMTLAQQDEGSRLICGITMGDPGAWTSWPPHQHTKDLEEVYCYFDIPKPRSAFHFASRNNGEFEFIHPVSSGDCVIIPEGYHPTCGMPGVKSCYFWVMSAHSPDNRRYDLAVNDPKFER